MNYVDALLRADASLVGEKDTAKYQSKKLGKLIGLNGPADIEIIELPTRRVNALVGRYFNKKGDYDYERSFDANCALVAEGVVDPSLKSKELQEHFGAATPANLAEKIFKAEISAIAMKIIKLSGINSDEDEEDEAEETIKNL